MPKSPAASATPRPLIFGEALFDVFPDDTAVLGGAPFNVAWHLQGLGLAPLFVSRVGDDTKGTQVLEAMRAWGMDTGGVQTDPTHPTGTVNIFFEGDGHGFDILAEQAYDFIDHDQATQAADDDFALLYCGTLAARHAVSRNALQGLVERGIPRFVDINLRAPWWDRSGVEAALRGARWAKLNDEELTAIAPPGTNLEDRTRALRRDYKLELLVLTLGARGSRFVTEAETLIGQPVAVTEIVDTVGAGDAFSAVTILGLLRHWPLALTQQRALAFAADVCRLRGATTFDNDFYASHLTAWED